MNEFLLGTLSPIYTKIGVESPSPANSIISDNCSGSGMSINGCDGSGKMNNLNQTTTLMDQTNNNSISSIRSSSPTPSQQQNGDGNCNENCPMQCIRFSPFQQQNWHTLCDQSLQELYVNRNNCKNC